MNNLRDLFLLGASHHRAPLSVRERLALGDVGVSSLLSDLAGVDGLREIVVLGTCNRIELYGVGNGSGVIGGVEAAFCANRQFSADEFASLRIRLTGREAALHLFRVVAGLDSQMLGETEIFGQVKSAYGKAQASNCTGPTLNRVFQKAFQAAKFVRTHTAIGTGQTSVANVAVDVAQNIFGDLASARVLLLGAGDIGRKTFKAFRGRGVASPCVANRRGVAASEFAGCEDTRFIEIARCEDHLADFDVIVGATASPDIVVSCSAVAGTMRSRGSRPLLLIDLALPRDFASEAGSVENVFLYNLDDLSAIASSNQGKRQAEAQKADAILCEWVSRLWPESPGCGVIATPAAIFTSNINPVVSAHSSYAHVALAPST